MAPERSRTGEPISEAGERQLGATQQVYIATQQWAPLLKALPEGYAIVPDLDTMRSQAMAPPIMAMASDGTYTFDPAEVARLISGSASPHGSASNSTIKSHAPGRMLNAPFTFSLALSAEHPSFHVTVGRVYISGQPDESDTPSGTKELEEEEKANEALSAEVDAIIKRLETGISAERSAMDALLDRLASSARR